MTQDTSSTNETLKPLEGSQTEAVGGGIDMCNIAQVTGQLAQAYDNLVDATSHVIERVITAGKSF